MYVSLTEAMIILAVISITAVIWVGGYTVVRSYDMTNLFLAHILNIHNALESVAYMPNNSLLINVGIPINTRIVFEENTIGIRVFNPHINTQVLYAELEKNILENDYKRIVENIEYSGDEIKITYKIPFSESFELRYTDTVLKISFTRKGEFSIESPGVKP